MTLAPASSVRVDGGASGARWFGAGASDDRDPAAAAEAATTAAMRGTDPQLVLVFASTQYCTDVVVETISALTPGVPMIGCTTAGEISTGRAGGLGISIGILGGGFSVATTLAENAAADLFAAGASAASAVKELEPTPHQVLMMLTDGLAGNQQDIVRGAYAEVGAGVPLVGGCAGDDASMTKTLQIFDGAIHEDAVVAAAIGSASPLSIGVRHGWRPIGEPMLVTRSTGTMVHELDETPALDTYLRRCGAPPAAATDPEAFTRFSITHPLGLRRRSGEEVRFISGADMESRALNTIAEVPQGSLVWLMEGDTSSVLDGTSASCAAALDGLGDSEPIGLVLFDCIARRNVLGPSGLADEMAAIGDLIPDVPAAGFYTYGEIARTHGVRGFHNQTLVTLALS